MTAAKDDERENEERSKIQNQIYNISFQPRPIFASPSISRPPAPPQRCTPLRALWRRNAGNPMVGLFARVWLAAQPQGLRVKSPMGQNGWE
jgi:hypothetical protein